MQHRIIQKEYMLAGDDMTDYISTKDIVRYIDRRCSEMKTDCG